MILDASAVVALRSAHDRHAERAVALVVGARGLVVHPVTLASASSSPPAPDRYVLALAEQLGEQLATFDDGLRSEAAARGVETAG